MCVGGGGGGGGGGVLVHFIVNDIKEELKTSQLVSFVFAAQ